MKVSVGDRFGYLTVVELVKDAKNPKARCICDCGNHAIPQRGALINGRAKSCGCKRSKDFVERNTKHGMSGTKIYHVWSGMLDRCRNEKNKAYKNYGGRGIEVAQEWMNFTNFYCDMGVPEKGMTLERLNTNGPYSKENCVWDTQKAQLKNTRASKRWIINGTEYETSGAAAKALGIDSSTVNNRVNGRWARGKFYKPWPGYSSRLVYEKNTKKAPKQ